MIQFLHYALIMWRSFNMDLIHENIVNIALNAGALQASGEIYANDSFELTAKIIELAEKFESEFGQAVVETGDYIEIIDNFAEKELKAVYGVEDKKVATIAWWGTDLYEIFNIYNVETNQENIDTFINAGGSRVLSDRSIEEGWEIIDIIVSDYIITGKLKVKA